jgi:hypothetical protein
MGSKKDDSFLIRDGACARVVALATEVEGALVPRLHFLRPDLLPKQTAYCGISYPKIRVGAVIPNDSCEECLRAYRAEGES